MATGRYEGISRIVGSRSSGLEEGQHVLTFYDPPVGECFNEFQRVGAGYCVPLLTVTSRSTVNGSTTWDSDLRDASASQRLVKRLP